MQYILNGSFPFIHKIQDRGFQTGTGSGGGMPLTFDYWYDYTPYGTSTAGVKVDRATALKQSAYWRAVNLISSQVASLPIGLYKRLENGDTEEVTDHPAVPLIKRKPNDSQNPLIWRESMQACALTMGNGYSYIKRTGDGTPLGLELLDPAEVEPIMKNGSLIYKLGADTGVDPFYVLHVPALSMRGIKGLSVLEAGAESMGVNLAMQKFKGDMFKNGAKQTGILTHPMPLSNKARDGVGRSFDEKMAKKDGGTMILDEGMKFQSLSWSPIDAQLIQLEALGIQDIARFFGIPPHLLFDESRSTFNNIAEQGLQFVIYTLRQWVTRWEAELNAKLLSEEEAVDHGFKFNMNALMRGDLKSRYEAYAIGIVNRFIRPNEARAWEELNRIEGGDEFPDFQKSANENTE